MCSELFASHGAMCSSGPPDLNLTITLKGGCVGIFILHVERLRHGLSM